MKKQNSKKVKEPCLSDKIETFRDKAIITSLESIKVEDVKEFIRLLKEDEAFKENGGELAEWLHNTYERISREVNWKTQKKCQVEFKDLPKENKSVMLRVAQAIQLKYLTRILLKIDKLAGGKLV